MGQINIERINSFIGEIREARQRINSLLLLPEDEIINDANKLGSLKYHLIVAIQAAIDICYHIAAQKGARAPQDYGDCFKNLVEIGVLEKDLGLRLIQMAKFRNLLIHLYWQVDDARVCKIARENTDDLELFIMALAKLKVRPG